MFHVEHSSENKLYLTCCDYAVTGEFFDVITDQNNQLLKTKFLLDQNSLNKYYDTDRYISHSDQKPKLFDKLYFTARRFTQYQKLRLLSKFKSKDSRLLDFGAGVGHFVQNARINNWNAYGVEPNLKARSIANSKGTEIVFPLTYLKSISYNSQSVITLWHVLEHLPNPNEQIKDLKNLLRQDGRFVVAVPNFKSYDAQYYGTYWAAYDVPRHLWHFSKNAISQLFEKHDMEIESIHPMWLDAFYVGLLSTKYKFKKMKILKGFWIGLVSNLKAIKTGEFSSLIYVIRHKKPN